MSVTLKKAEVCKCAHCNTTVYLAPKHNIPEHMIFCDRCEEILAAIGTEAIDKFNKTYGTSRR